METQETVRVLVCRPKQSPTVEDVPNEFETWQELVKGTGERKGRVQYIHLEDGVQMICNEDGQYVCEPNRLVPGRAPVPAVKPDFVFGAEGKADPGTIGVHRAFGTFALSRVGTKGACASLTDEDIRIWTAILHWTAP